MLGCNEKVKETDKMQSTRTRNGQWSMCRRCANRFESWRVCLGTLRSCHSTLHRCDDTDKTQKFYALEYTRSIYLYIRIIGQLLVVFRMDETLDSCRRKNSLKTIKTNKNINEIVQMNQTKWLYTHTTKTELNWTNERTKNMGTKNKKKKTETKTEQPKGNTNDKR